MSEDERDLKLRVHNPELQPTLIYLPGLHGDWTLVGGFRKAVAGKLRFAEFTYPRTLTWSLEQYAAAIEKKLSAQGITTGWLLGESFGSQLVWPLLTRRNFEAQGAVLAGGFVRHPIIWIVKLGAAVGNGLPLRLITAVLFGYARIARFRYRSDPAVLAGIDEFISRRTELDKQAAVHRLRLIAGNDPRRCASAVDRPVFAVTGFFDPVVPWVSVRGWLRRNCAALREYRIIPRADHNILGTVPEHAAAIIVPWIKQN